MKKQAGNKDLARIVTLVLVFILIGSLFGMRLVEIQIVDGAFYIAQSKKSTTSTVTINAARGEIVDRNGEPLARNRMGFNVVLEKAFVQDEFAVILKLVDLLEKHGEEYNDELPVSTTYPYEFISGRTLDVEKLISDLGLNVWATAENVMTAYEELYGLSEYTKDEIRTICGIKYTMTKNSYSSSVPFIFAEDVAMETVIKIKENNQEMVGVDIIETPFREYIDGNLVPHIIGTVGAITAEQYSKYKEIDSSYTQNDTVGQSGVEKAFEEYLRGQNGTREIVQNSAGEVVSDIIVDEAIPGNTIMLTIDKQLQLTATSSLESFIKNMNETAKENEGQDAKAGAVVVMDVKSGEVLASVSYPGYDLSTYQQDYATLITNELTPLFNRALNGQYMPGSIYKPMMTIAGLSEGIITPDSTFTCTGTYSFFGPLYTFTCTGIHGAINCRTALRYSCNIFFYETGRRLGIANINKYAVQFGLGVSTGVEIPESTGVLAGPDYRDSIGQDWYSGDVVQASIGQSDNLFTPLQLAQYTSTLANKGTRYEAHIVKEIASYNLDEVVIETKPVIMKTIDVNQEYFEVVREGMNMVAQSSGGSAYGTFKDYPIKVCCKTGTPQSVSGSNHASFIAYAPADDPQIAVALYVENGYGGYKAATIARDIFDEYFFGDEQTVSSETASVS